MYEAVALQSLGEAIIVSALSSAYYAMTKHPIYKRAKRYADGSDGLAFIKGEELDYTIEVFGLDVNPGRLRELFFIYIDKA